MVRKLSNTKGETNEGSFTLILPKEWCDLHNVKHGIELELLLDKIRPRTILIQLPEDGDQPQASELVLNDRDHKTGQARRRAILGGYLEGFNSIKLKNVSRKSEARLKIRGDIQDLVQKLDGCSVNEEERIFELTIASATRSPEELLKKLYSTTKLMFEDVFHAYLDYDMLLSEDLEQRDDGADKLYFSIVRELKLILREPYKASGENFKLIDVLDYRMVASQFENLCDASEYVAKALMGKNEGVHNIDQDEILRLNDAQRRKIRDIADIMTNALEEAYTAYEANNEEKAVDMATRKPEMEEYIAEMASYGVHSSLLEVVDEMKETIVDLLELIHASPEPL